MKQKLLLFVLLFCTIFTYAQYDSVKQPINTMNIDIDLESNIEHLAENAEEEEDYSELLENLIYYFENKININNPDYEILASIFRLSDYQLYHLQNYLLKYGKIYTQYELAIIDGFDKELIERLLPYIQFGEIEQNKRSSLKTIFRRGKNTILMRYGQVLEQQQGYSPISKEELEKRPNARYLGSPQAYLLKYRYRSGNRLQFGITAEKDAGEQFFKGKNKFGFDFYSIHFYIRNVSVFKQIAVGDYQLSFGQGLVMNTGFSTQSPQDGISIYNQASNVKPYSSANEMNYLRGFATTIDCKVLDLTLFYSYKRLDASLIEDTISSKEKFIETIYSTGYHRTYSEILKKNAIGQHIAGGHLTYRMRVAQIGATAYYTRFSSMFDKNLSQYNRFTFNSIDNINASLDYKVIIRKVFFFGETAISKNLALATINGFQFNIDPRFAMSILHRYYSPKYQCFNSGAYAQNSSNANEHGIYVGFHTILTKSLTWNSHFDYFLYPWLKYQVDAPSQGWEIQSQWNYYLNKRFSVYLRLRYKTANTNLSKEYYNLITSYNKQNYRLHLTWEPNSVLQLKSRLEIVNYQKEKNAKYQQGFLVYQDVKFKFSRLPFAISTRFAIFDTYSYDERIYAYEDDVLYSFSIPGYYYKGCRTYILLTYKVKNFLDIWFKIAQNHYLNKKQVGSSLTLIDKPQRTDVKLQMQWKF